jgi:hypothetical protein
MVIPYLASSRWYASLIAGASPAVSPHDLNRCVVKSNAGPRVLSIPIEGGFGALRRNPEGEHRVSEHGDWRRAHLSAFMSEYGRMPFFEHIYPMLAEALDKRNVLLSDINAKLHAMVLGMIWNDDIASELSRLRTARQEFYERLRADALRNVDMDLSVLDLLMRIGPESTFALAPVLLT